MNTLRLSFAALLAAASAVACTPNTAPVDAGQTETDAGQTETDAGQTETDAGQTETDAGQTETDAGMADAGMGMADAGMGMADAGMGMADAGMPPMATTYSLPQLLDATAMGHVAPCPQNDDCDPVRVENMVVTSEAIVAARDRMSGAPYLFAFFVADPTAVDGDGRALPYSGIQVTVAPGSNALTHNDYTFGVDAMGAFPEPSAVNYAGFPRPGDVVNVIGQSSAFYGMPQMRDVVALNTSDATVTAPMPAQFDGMAAEDSPRHPARLQGGRPALTAPVMREAIVADPAARSWLGVPVELTNVETIEACIGYPNSNSNPTHLRDRGNWIVTGGVEIGTLFTNDFGGEWVTLDSSSDLRTCENAGTLLDNDMTQKCADSREILQVFTSLKGISSVSFDVQRVNVLSNMDIAPSSLFAAPDAGACMAPMP